jgi:hypothetical protein
MTKRAPFHTVAAFSLVAGVIAGTAVPAFADPMIDGAVATHAIVRQNQDLASSRRGFDCSPMPIGKGTWATIRSTPAGTVAWWYCQSANGEWRVEWAAATARQMSVRNMFEELREVLAAPDRHAAFDAVVFRNVKMPLDDPDLAAVWHPFIAEMNAGKPAVLPVAERDSPEQTWVASASVPVRR